MHAQILQTTDSRQIRKVFIASNANGLIPHMSSKNDNNIAFYRNKTGFKEVLKGSNTTCVRSVSSTVYSNIHHFPWHNVVTKSSFKIRCLHIRARLKRLRHPTPPPKDVNHLLSDLKGRVYFCIHYWKFWVFRHYMLSLIVYNLSGNNPYLYCRNFYVVQYYRFMCFQYTWYFEHLKYFENLKK